MKLTESDKRHLRGLAHALRPCLHVGSAGVSPAVVAELVTALEHHELVKVKIRAQDRTERDAAVAALVERGAAVLVSRIGNVAVLYRPNPENPRNVLQGTRSKST
jgi:RNA-binding protein